MKWSDLLLPKPKFATHNLSKTVRGSFSPGILYPVYHKLMLPGDKFKIDIRNMFRTDPTVFPLMGSFKVRLVTVVSNLKNYCIALEGYRKSFDWRSVWLPYLQWKFPYGHMYKSRSAATDAQSIAQYGYYPGSPQTIAVRETSLADYLGYERGWLPTRQQYNTQYQEYGDGVVGNLYKSALPFLLYYDFYRNYMLNPQDDFVPLFAPVGYVEKQSDNTYLNRAKTSVLPYEAFLFDRLIEEIHKQYDGNGQPKSVNEILYDLSIDYADSNVTRLLRWSGFAPESSPIGWYGYDNANTFSVPHGGLLGTMYDSDVNTQWLSVDNYQRFNEVVVKSNVAGDVASTSFQDIVKASSLWQFLMGEVYGDGTYSGHIYGQYGVSVKSEMNIPQIVHVMDSRIDFENITSQSDTTVTNAKDEIVSGSKLGQQAAVGRSFGQGGRFTVSNNDNNLCMLMTFLWITPEIDYSTGFNPLDNIVKLSDVYVPAFDNYSLEARFQESVNSSPIYGDSLAYGTIEADPFSDSAELYHNTNVPHGADALPADYALGYQPAYTPYKTDVNEVRGLFRESMRDYTLLRSFPKVGNSAFTNGYITGYVYTPFPAPTVSVGSQGIIEEWKSQTYNNPFSLNRQDNFFGQIRFNITAIRPISKSAIPNVK